MLASSTWPFGPPPANENGCAAGLRLVPLPRTVRVPGSNLPGAASPLASWTPGTPQAPPIVAPILGSTYGRFCTPPGTHSDVPKGRDMDVLYERCCGLDVHKKTVVACVIEPGSKGKPRKTIRTFGTMTDDLLALGDWLAAEEVSHVAMESTGVYWQPIVRHEALFDREGMKGPLLRAVAAVR